MEAGEDPGPHPPRNPTKIFFIYIPPVFLNTPSFSRRSRKLEPRSRSKRTRTRFILGHCSLVVQRLIRGLVCALPLLAYAISCRAPEWCHAGWTDGPDAGYLTDQRTVALGGTSRANAASSQKSEHDTRRGDHRAQLLVPAPAGKAEVALTRFCTSNFSYASEGPTRPTLYRYRKSHRKGTTMERATTYCNVSLPFGFASPSPLSQALSDEFSQLSLLHMPACCGCVNCT